MIIYIYLAFIVLLTLLVTIDAFVKINLGRYDRLEHIR